MPLKNRSTSSDARRPAGEVVGLRRERLRRRHRGTPGRRGDRERAAAACGTERTLGRDTTIVSTLERAVAIAAQAHAGQRDKAGEPYILHPLRVMLRMATDELQIVAVLHDVLEDGALSDRGGAYSYSWPSIFSGCLASGARSGSPATSGVGAFVASLKIGTITGRSRFSSSFAGWRMSCTDLVKSSNRPHVRSSALVGV